MLREKKKRRRRTDTSTLMLEYRLKKILDDAECMEIQFVFVVL